MIIQGGRAGNVKFWASHLLRADTNDKAEVKEFRGLVAGDLKGALREMQAVAGASRCDENFMYQANINPRDHERLSPEQWQKAVDTLEKNLGFEGHARVVVEHEKEGRQHYHVIWSRVDADLRAVSPWNNYATHQQTARQLEREFGLEHVPERRLGDRPIQLWEEQKAEQTRIDPKAMKAELSALWRETDSGQAFAAALHERGYILARGDRRDFCVIDHAGTAHSLARRLDGVKAAEVRERMADINRESLPSVAEARAAQQERFLDPAGAWAERNDPIRLEQGRTSHSTGDGLEWTGRGGMAAQQKSALEWFEKSQERDDAKQEPKAEKTGLDRFRYRGGAGRDRDDGHDLDR